MRHIFHKLFTALVAGVFALPAVMAPATASASLSMAHELPELTLRADRVVIAQVSAVVTEWDSSHTTIVSRVELMIEEGLKGQVPGNRRLRLVQVGGQVGDTVMRVAGQPEFVAGERAVLFLEGPALDCRLVGLGQGKRPLRFDAAGGRWMAEAGDHSSAVQLGAGGEIRHVSPEGPRALADLRSDVQALVRRQARGAR